MRDSIYILMLCFVFACKADSQPAEYIPFQKVAALSHNIRETSGLAHAEEGMLYTHNDGGSASYLYKISQYTGDILKAIDVENGRNIDWEDLAEDSSYVYIGDFGNNRGNRDNLRVLRIRKNALFLDEEPEAEKIRFTYADQESLKPRGKHDFDCEAFVAYGDSLYLFTKNRETFTSNVYRLPKDPGEYIAEKVGHFDTEGLVTGADVRIGATQALALVGYRNEGMRYGAFIWLFTGFQGANFFSGKKLRLELAPHLQVEGVVWDTDSTLLITNEARPGGSAALQRISLAGYLK